MSPETAHQVEHLLTVALAGLFEALIPFAILASPLYWPFLLSTIVVALLYWRFCAPERGTWQAFRRRFLSRELWWHPSARADYRYYIVNAVIYPLVAAPGLATGGIIASGLHGAFRPMLGVPHAPLAAGWEVTLVYTLAFFVAYDFGRFIAHSALHDVPVLWEFHKTHHSAEVLTPFTAYRVHPVDLAMMSLGSGIATGVITWVFQWLGGPAISFYEFLQMHVLLWGFNLLGNLKHWQVPISYGAVLDRWLISPRHHQIHHSAEPRHFGCNRGFEIALWDRLYGTLALPRAGDTFRTGLGDGSDGAWHRVWKLYCWPLWFAGKRMVHGVVRPHGAPASGGVP